MEKIADKKKILFISHSEKTIGGAEEDLKRLVFHFNEKYDIYLALPDQKKLVNIYEGKVKEIILINSNIPPLQTGSSLDYFKFYIKSFLQSRKLIPKINRINPDLVVFNSSVLFPLCSYLKDYKQITFVREFLLKNSFRKNAFKKICRNSDHVICVSGFISSEIKKSGCANVTTIYTSVEFLDNAEKSSREFMNKDHFNFINVGVISPLKNQKVVIEAFAKILKRYENIRLHFIGKYYDDSEYYNDLIDFVDSNNLNNFVSFTGELNREAVYDYFRQSNCVIISSITEGMPNIVSESLSFGKPLITSNFNGIEEIIKNGINGFIFNTPDELEKLMMEIIENKDLRDFIIKNSKSTVDEFFNLNENLIKVGSIFKKVLSN